MMRHISEHPRVKAQRDKYEHLHVWAVWQVGTGTKARDLTYAQAAAMRAKLGVWGRVALQGEQGPRAYTYTYERDTLQGWRNIRAENNPDEAAHVERERYSERMKRRRKYRRRV
jgi:hypothetical protein